MSNNKQQPKPENPNNQFSNTEPLTHAQRVAIANKMSNNKQSSIDFLLKELEEIGVLNIKNCHWSDEVDVKKAIEQAKAMQQEQAQLYATFVLKCVQNNLPTITFNDWINLDNNEQQ